MKTFNIALVIVGCLLLHHTHNYGFLAGAVAEVMHQSELKKAKTIISTGPLEDFENKVHLRTWDHSALEELNDHTAVHCSAIAVAEMQIREDLQKAESEQAPSRKRKIDEYPLVPINPKIDSDREMPDANIKKELADLEVEKKRLNVIKGALEAELNPANWETVYYEIYCGKRNIIKMQRK